MSQPATDPAVVCTYGPSGIGKCLAGTALVTLASGKQTTVQEIVSSNALAEKILALDGNWNLVPAKIGKVWDNGIKPVVRVKTKSGRQVDVTMNHPLLGADGWKPVTSFELGDLVAVPRSYTSPEGQQPASYPAVLTDGQVKFLAYHLANGRFFDSSITFSSGNAEIVADFKQAVETAFPDTEVRLVTVRDEPTIDYRVAKRSMVGGQKQTSKAMQFLRDQGLEGKASAEKFVPDCILAAPRVQQELFLSRYLGCDGCVEACGRISFCSASEVMSRQVVHLLLRVGVWGSLRDKEVDEKTYWEWSTGDWGCKHGMAALAGGDGLFTKPIPKEWLERPARGNHHDRLPITRGDFYERVGQRTWSSPDSYISRRKAQGLIFPTPRNPVQQGLADMVHSAAVFWDSIVEIEPLGEVPTYDLTIPEHHNFVADDFFVHNTTDMGYSFPRALFAAAPGALNSVKSVCGYEPHYTDKVRTIMEATQLIAAVTGKVDTIVFDDFSFLAEQTFNYLEKERRLSGFKLWGALRDATLEFRDKSRFCGVNVVLNAWEQPPKVNQAGKRIKGGPKLSGDLPEKLPAMCDVVLRAVHELQRKPWPTAYQCRVDPSYSMKDRFNVATLCDPAPMNLAEILRAAGFDMPRHPDFPKQETQVEQIAALLAKEPENHAEIANMMYANILKKDYTVEYARWTLRDALDRAVIRRSMAQATSTFIDTTSPLAL